MANIIQDGSYVLAADTEELKGFEQEKLRKKIRVREKNQGQSTFFSESRLFSAKEIVL